MRDVRDIITPVCAANGIGLTIAGTKDESTMLKISFYRSYLFLAVVGLASATACSSASTQQTNAGATRSTSAALATANDLLKNTLFPTGVDANGNSLAFGSPDNPPVPDPHYTVTSTADPPDPNCNGHAYAVSVGNVPAVAGTWVDPTKLTDPTTNALWISCATPDDQGAVDPAGASNTDFTYATTLIIPAGVPASTVQVTGHWACDNRCTIKVNDTQVADTTKPADPNDDQGFRTTGEFIIPQGTFVAGENKIEFVVTNTDSTNDNSTNPEGLLINNDITVTGGCTAGGNECGNGNTCENTGLCTLYPNGQGNCSTDDKAANYAVTVCDKGVCGSDGTCGLATDDACTQDQATQCRSGVCTAQDTCQAPDDCDANGACADTKYCDAATNKCLPKLNNGSPCDSQAMCRSNACSANNHCMPSGGCNVDADCNESTPVCDANQCVVAPVVVPDTDSGTPAPTEDAGTNGSSAANIPGGGSSCSVPAGANHSAGFGSVAGITAIAFAGLIRRRRSS
jgi:hypothetical protein